MSQSSVLSLPQSFEAYQIVLLMVSTLYTGLFVMISNHYVFKPKVQQFLVESSIQSHLWHQFIVDCLSNLTHLTFVLTSLLLLQDDNSLSVMLYSDISWTGLFMCLVAFKTLNPKEQPNYRLFLLKNVIFLALIYALIGSHYISQVYLITLGIGLVIFYLINLVISGYQDKFVEAMQALFGYKPTGVAQEEYDDNNNMISPQALNRLFPTCKTQINDHIRNHFAKIKNINLKTKRTMVQNLLKISLAVHLSKQKMENKAKRDVKYYYGTFNGTVIEKSKKVLFDKAAKQENSSQIQLTEQRNTEDFQAHNSAIFYIFPVKFVEGNKVMSVIFSISINLGFGVLLSIALKMTETIRYGQYLQIIFGLLLLPILPSISKEEFLNNMALSSLWKYCLYGLFLTMNCLTSDSLVYFSFSSNQQLTFTPFIQFLALILTAYFVFSSKASPYSFSFIWLSALLASVFLIFKKC